ncbi:MAG: HAD family phosphatase [Phycisphaerae bacterium]|jgi:HAD superfamily hydrolase (TIGR01509 family)
MKAFIFDLDGVLVDDEAAKFKAISATFKDLFNVELPQDDKIWIGRDEHTNMQYFMDMFGIKEDVDRVVRIKRDNMNKSISNKEFPLIISSLEFMKQKKKEGYKIAVASNSIREYVEAILASYKIKRFIDVVVTKDEVSHPKPHPEAYLITAKKLGLEPEDCVAIEDSPTGIKAAKAAGMECIAITTTHTKKELMKAMPDNIFERLTI